MAVTKLLLGALLLVGLTDSATRTSPTWRFDRKCRLCSDRRPCSNGARCLALNPSSGYSLGCCAPPMKKGQECRPGFDVCPLDTECLLKEGEKLHRCAQKVCEGLPPCGGFAGFVCEAGSRCVDDPFDGCSPQSGGADCGGCCVPLPATNTPETGAPPTPEPQGSISICCTSRPQCPSGFEEAPACRNEELTDGTCVEEVMCCKAILCRKQPCEQCGGPTGQACPAGYECATDACDPARSSQCIGCCRPASGGLCTGKDACGRGGVCSPGFVCADDPTDRCIPQAFECPNCCVPDACAGVKCASGTCHTDASGDAGCFEGCTLQCGTTVPHGWTGSDEGTNWCNDGRCEGGNLVYLTRTSCRELNPTCLAEGDVCGDAEGLIIRTDCPVGTTCSRDAPDAPYHCLRL